MNKKKKIAIAAVSLVMAGTMALGIAGCVGGGTGTGGGGGGSVVTPKLDEDGKLTYAAGTELRLNIGYQKKNQPAGLAFTTTDLSGKSLLADGKEYGVGNLKPAWQGLQDKLGIKITDSFKNLGSGEQITDPITSKTINKYDAISGSIEEIGKQSSEFINIAEYLDYMPNYKAFLEAYPVTMYSLTGNTSTGAMYAAPYFDGNDDIEKYALMNYLLVEKILDNDYSAGTASYKQQLDAKKGPAANSATDAYKALGADSTKPYATAYMTDDYTIETTDPTDPDAKKTVTVSVKPSVAYTQATTSGTPLYNAVYEAAGNVAYENTGHSGNIVDLQNWAITKSQGNVTGNQLAKILREYIKVAYTIDSNAAYSEGKLSDVFLSVSAAWDVDLLVGLCRAAITDPGSSQNGDLQQYGISGRQTTTQRRIDLVALAGELYGVRGMESRYEYTYLNEDGDIVDARSDEKTYELLNNMSNLAKEGIIYVGGLKQVEKDGKKTYEATTMSSSNTAGDRTLMMHDYVQTQTSAGLDTTNYGKDKYYFAPIVNAVSKWDTDGDGTHETTMRFTESWRSVKNTGFAIPKAAIGNNSDKLSAILTLIDYMFSNDGQILLTYGPQSTVNEVVTAPSGSNPGVYKADGWWYAEESSLALNTVVDSTKTIAAYGKVPAQYVLKDEYKDKCFIYNGKVYEGIEYSGRRIPELTEANKALYHGESIKLQLTSGTSAAIKVTSGNLKIQEIKNNFTNYARYIIGTTLPVGNKDQGFEFQATSECGIDGALTVGKAIANGTIKHVKLAVDENESYWYLTVPTMLPLTKADQDELGGQVQNNISAKYFLNKNAVDQISNIAIDMVLYGFGSSIKPCEDDKLFNGSYEGVTAKTIADFLAANGLPARVAIMTDNWNKLRTLYEIA